MINKNLIDFQEILDKILKYKDIDVNEKDDSIIFVSTILLLFFIVFFLVYWIWTGSSLDYSSFMGVFNIMGRLILSLFPFIYIIGSVQLLVRCKLRNAARKEKKIAYEKISGKNIKNYFNDLYFSLEDNKSALDKLEKLVNKLSVNDEIEPDEIAEFNNIIKEKLESFKRIEKTKVNFFQEYKSNLDRQSFNKKMEDNISFFEKNN